jgi:hypothetical protein
LPKIRVSLLFVATIAAVGFGCGGGAMSVGGTDSGAGTAGADGATVAVTSDGMTTGTGDGGGTDMTGAGAMSVGGASGTGGSGNSAGNPDRDGGGIDAGMSIDSVADMATGIDGTGIGGAAGSGASGTGDRDNRDSGAAASGASDTGMTVDSGQDTTTTIDGPGTGGAVITADAGGIGGGVDIPENVDLQDYPGLRSRIDCRKLLDCCTFPELVALTGMTSFSIQGCVDSLSSVGTAEVAAIQESIAAGRLLYHGDKAADCLKIDAAQSCADARAGMIKDPMGACVGLLEPKVPLNGACVDSGECINSWCASSPSAATGTCAAMLANGAPCWAGFQCTSGSCDGATMRCAPPLPPTGGLCSVR